MQVTPHSGLRRHAIALVLILMAAALAGCATTGGEDDAGDAPDDAMYASFDAALAAPGEVYAPDGSDSPVRLKVLEPATTEGLATGAQDVVVLLYDADANAPVTDAEFVIRAEMPAMGHGTSPEEDPAHDAHGVYAGMTTFAMPGGWIINLEPQLASGEVLYFTVDVTVGQGDSGDDGDADGDADGGTDDGNATTDDGGDTDGNATGAQGGAGDGDADDQVYAAARAANGTTYAPAEANGHRFDITVTAMNSGETYWFEVEGYDGKNPAITLVPGSTYTVRFENSGGTIHNFAVDPAAATDCATESGEMGHSACSTDIVQDGGSDTLTFTVAEDAPATFEYWCDPHKGMGMKGDVTSDADAAGRNLALKLLEPEDPDNAKTKQQPLRVLLYDADADAPVTNATFALESWMPAMGHGTSSETDPVHNGSGVYEGVTNHIMQGEWEVRLNATLPGGAYHYYVLPFDVTRSG